MKSTIQNKPTPTINSTKTQLIEHMRDGSIFMTLPNDFNFDKDEESTKEDTLLAVVVHPGTSQYTIGTVINVCRILTQFTLKQGTVTLEN